jgi:hypothetical protein
MSTDDNKREFSIGHEGGYSKMFRFFSKSSVNCLFFFFFFLHFFSNSQTVMVEHLYKVLGLTSSATLVEIKKV